ncbi:hypothetical protein [Primorskyibacter sp. 2E107]|uniref:hypothetical protein n=1 Tax=Primorskyibacter sp. 2E107 TaxID=3403458 RepID=UPI003AF8D75C
MLLFGGLLALVGNTAKGSLPVVGAALEAFGLLVAYSFLLSWLGHLPLAVVLHMAFRRGRGGWLVAVLAAGGIGLFWAQVLATPIILPFALVGGVLQAWLLRRAVLVRASLS